MQSNLELVRGGSRRIMRKAREYMVLKIKLRTLEVKQAVGSS